MAITKQQIRELQEEILSWYSVHQRSLPWREIPYDTNHDQRDPYKILISEVMSQQTQISRVIPKYEAWLMKFPTVTDLATAPTSEVLKYWSGLGYNRRAINLQKAAQEIVTYSRDCRSLEKGNPDPRFLEDDNIFWPRTVEELKKLPGIGEYTASAIACFAFNQQIAVVDTNVRKVIIKKVLKETEGTNEVANMAEIKSIAEQLLPEGKAYEWNQALMDYAAANLKKEKISVPKQSTFKGSDRYYRGQTVKLLIEYNRVSIKALGKRLQRDELFIGKIVDSLVKDGIVKRENDQIFLP